jgi:hypothetical protein
MNPPTASRVGLAGPYSKPPVRGHQPIEPAAPMPYSALFQLRVLT